MKTTHKFAPIFINGRECLTEPDAWRELLIYPQGDRAKVFVIIEPEPDPIRDAIDRACVDFVVNG